VVDVDDEPKDYTLQLVARLHNDKYFVTCMNDFRKDVMILDIPEFDSKYVSFMITGYDHYVKIQLSTRLGHFEHPEKLWTYSAGKRTRESNCKDISNELHWGRRSYPYSSWSGELIPVNE